MTIDTKAIEERVAENYWNGHDEYGFKKYDAEGQAIVDITDLLSAVKEKDAEIAKLREGLETMMKAVGELRHAHEVGPDWYSGSEQYSGKQRMWNYIRLWTDKANVAYAALTAQEPKS